MTGRGRTAAFWTALAGAVLLVALVSGPGARDGAPLDPESTGRYGTKAMVMLLRELGAQPEVTRTGPGPSQSTAVLLTGQAGPGLTEWVERGGTLLVVNPTTDLSPSTAGEPRNDVDIRRACPIPALAGVRHIEVESAQALVAPAGATGCFPMRGGHFLVATPRGDGHIVALGGPLVLVNSGLGRADNAALVAAVLAPAPGTQVAVVAGAPAGEGRQGLLALVDPRVKSGVVQLLVAFAAVVAWRARRLGRPVAEDVPVEVSGSEMVEAVGRLLQQGRHRRRAAHIMQADLRRLVAERMGEADVAARTGLAPAVVDRALSFDPSTDDELVAVAQAVETVRQEVVHAR